MKTVALTCNTNTNKWVIETISKMTTKFREAEMCRNIKEYQGQISRSNQHKGEYLKGDRIWILI